jgi:hypothetical protein
MNREKAELHDYRNQIREKGGLGTMAELFKKGERKN